MIQEDISAVSEHNLSELSRDNYASSIIKRKKTSKKKMPLIIACAIVAVVVAVAGIYIVIAQSYEGKFLPNTYVQSADVSGMTWQEATEAVSEQFQKSETIIVENGQEDIVITGESLELHPVGGEMEKLVQEQNKWDWLSYQFDGRHDLSVGVQYDEQVLMDAVSELDCVNAETRTLPQNASIVYDEEKGTFIAAEPVTGNLVDEGALLSAISQSIANGGGTVDVSELYVQPVHGVDSPEIVEAVNEANRVINKSITYNIDMIDNAETLTKDQIVSFVVLGDDGTLTVDEDAVAGWLREMGKKYDTAGQPKSYTTAYGKQVELAGGTYGWITDEAGMLPIVKENILSKENVVDQDFVYQQEAAGPAGSGEWGDTYIDIDITDQKVRVIQNGEITHDFVCITGKPDGKHDSTEGEHQIVRIEKDFVMTGELDANGVPEYRTPCDFFLAWCADGCAMHDAPWQSWDTWNKLKYKNGAGSHGCANMRPTDVAVIYDIAYMGMPVLVHK